MFRSFVRAAAALALVAIALSGSLGAAPGPGLQYDEIVRAVINATPPPPGQFQQDVAALSAPPSAAPATPAPRRRGGLGALAGAVLTGRTDDIGGAAASAVVSNVLDAAMDRALQNAAGGFAAAFRSLTQGRVERHAYYNGWERVDDVAAQTATIRKCDLNQIVKLDLAKKTYAVFDPNSEPPDAPAAGPQPRNRRTEPPRAEEPGTAVADVGDTVRSLGTMRIEGYDAAGYDQQTTFAMTQATGSCRNGSTSVQMRAYYTKLAQPRLVCPIRASRQRYPEAPVNFVAQGGCRPTFTAHKSGPVPPADKLALYQAFTFGASAGAATPAPSASAPPAFTFLTERGNVRTLTAADASLFEIPKDFTKVP